MIFDNRWDTMISEISIKNVLFAVFNPQCTSGKKSLDILPVSRRFYLVLSLKGDMIGKVPVNDFFVSVLCEFTDDLHLFERIRLR